MDAELLREAHVKNYMHDYMCPVIGQCDECGEDITNNDGRYVCPECEELLCLNCSRTKNGLSMLNVADDPYAIINLEAGDIILAGPTAFGIHHVILVASELKMDSELHGHLMEELHSVPGEQLWYCSTIESTQGSTGNDTWWYPTKTYFLRDPANRTAVLCADWPEPHSDTAVNVAEEAVPFKVILHPLRKEAGGPGLDKALFAKVIAESAEESRVYGKSTVVKAWINQRAQRHLGVREPCLEDYPTAEARKQLIEDYKQCWESKPICATVAVKTWQKYFYAKNRGNADKAALDMMRYMPSFCDRIIPSQLTKTLIDCGWFIVDNLEEEAA